MANSGITVMRAAVLPKKDWRMRSIEWNRLFIDKSPFINPPNIKEKTQWVRPKLVCEVEYAELTADDQLRQTTFLGWRDDKKAQEVVLE
jgi:ATP-dependent DNA ligase